MGEVDAYGMWEEGAAEAQERHGAPPGLERAS